MEQQRQWEKGKTLSYDEALDEVVANACQTMLLDSKAINKLARQNMTLAEKIADYIEDWTNKVREAFEEVNPEEGEIFRGLRDMMDSLEKMQELWDNGLLAASENYDAGQRAPSVTAASSGDSSLREGANENAATEGGGKAEKNTTKDGKAQKFSYDSYPAEAYYTDGSIYSYDFLTAQKPMKIAEMPALSEVKDGNDVSRDKASELGLKNAAKIGRRINDTVYGVTNSYTGREIRVSDGGLRHGLDASNVGRMRTNARLSAVAGTVVQNGIPINGLTTEKSKKAQVKGTYALATLMRSGDKYVVAISTIEQMSQNLDNIDYIDVTHAINGRIKRDGRSSTRELGFLNPTTSISEINISDFLGIVNETHRSILSNDVLARLGEKRPADGYYTGRALFQAWDDLTDDTAAEKDGREVAYARIEAENAALSETVAALKKLTGKQEKTIGALQRRLQLTKTPEVRESDARKMAKALTKEFRSTADAEGDDFLLLGRKILLCNPAPRMLQEQGVKSLDFFVLRLTSSAGGIAGGDGLLAGAGEERLVFVRYIADAFTVWVVELFRVGIENVVTGRGTAGCGCCVRGHSGR